jgi:hypothetical protein
MSFDNRQPKSLLSHIHSSTISSPFISHGIVPVDDIELLAESTRPLWLPQGQKTTLISFGNSRNTLRREGPLLQLRLGKASGCGRQGWEFNPGIMR